MGRPHSVKPRWQERADPKVGAAMVADFDYPNRRSIRLRDYDYAQAGAYFITLCTVGRESLFGEMVSGAMWLFAPGLIVEEEWLRTAAVRSNVELDAYVVMPNHLHGIVIPANEARATHRVAPTNGPAGPASGSIGAIVAQFKAVTTKRIHRLSGPEGLSIWQRNYYEHLIRNDRDLERIRDYIEANPSRWAHDAENPMRTLL